MSLRLLTEEKDLFCLIVRVSTVVNTYPTATGPIETAQAIVWKPVLKQYVRITTVTALVGPRGLIREGGLFKKLDKKDIYESFISFYLIFCRCNIQFYESNTSIRRVLIPNYIKINMQRL